MSVAPRFFVEAHLGQLFEADPDATESGAGSARPLPVSAPGELAAANVARHDWIAEGGRQNRQAREPGLPTHQRHEGEPHGPRCFPDAPEQGRIRFCSCPDHPRAKAAGERCKHVHAAEIAAAKLRTARLRMEG